MDAIESLGLLVKGVARGGKYIRREPTGNPARPWRYIYAEPAQTGPQASPPPAKRRWVRGEEYGLSDTKQQHAPGGQYTPEREKLHAAVVEKYTAGVPSVPPTHKPVAVMTIGGTASGKTTLVKHLMGDTRDYAVVNPDEMKEEIPEYKKGLDLGSDEAGLPVTAIDSAFLVHEESSDMAEKVRQAAMSKRQNMIIDGTGKNVEKFAAKVAELKAAGYHVRILMPIIGEDEAHERSLARAEKTGRHVPEEFVRGSHRAVLRNFEHLAALGDDFAVFESRQPPRVVYSGDASGARKEHDPAFVRKMREASRKVEWLKAMRAAEMQKGGDGLPPSVPLDDFVQRIEKGTDRGKKERGTPGAGVHWPVEGFEEEGRKHMEREIKKKQGAGSRPDKKKAAGDAERSRILSLFGKLGPHVQSAPPQMAPQNLRTQIKPLGPPEGGAGSDQEAHGTYEQQAAADRAEGAEYRRVRGIPETEGHMVGKQRPMGPRIHSEPAESDVVVKQTGDTQYDASLPKGERMAYAPSKYDDAPALPRTKPEALAMRSMDAVETLGALVKAGEERPHHKYVRREPRGDGSFRYIYRTPEGHEVEKNPIDHLREVVSPIKKVPGKRAGAQATPSREAIGHALKAVQEHATEGPKQKRAALGAVREALGHARTHAQELQAKHYSRGSDSESRAGAGTSDAMHDARQIRDELDAHRDHLAGGAEKRSKAARKQQEDALVAPIKEKHAKLYEQRLQQEGLLELAKQGKAPPDRVEAIRKEVLDSFQKEKAQFLTQRAMGSAQADVEKQRAAIAKKTGSSPAPQRDPVREAQQSGSAPGPGIRHRVPELDEYKAKQAAEKAKAAGGGGGAGAPAAQGGGALATIPAAGEPPAKPAPKKTPQVPAMAGMSPLGMKPPAGGGAPPSGGGVGDIHARVAAALGWTVQQAQSMPLPALREQVRHIPALKAELDQLIQGGGAIRGAPSGGVRVVQPGDTEGLPPHLVAPPPISAQSGSAPPAVPGATPPPSAGIPPQTGAGVLPNPAQGGAPPFKHPAAEYSRGGREEPAGPGGVGKLDAGRHMALEARLDRVRGALGGRDIHDPVHRHVDEAASAHALHDYDHAESHLAHAEGIIAASTPVTQPGQTPGMPGQPLPQPPPQVGAPGQPQAGPPQGPPGRGGPPQRGGFQPGRPGQPMHRSATEVMLDGLRKAGGGWKYIKKTPKPGGGFTYTYAHEESKLRAHAGKRVTGKEIDDHVMTQRHIAFLHDVYLPGALTSEEQFAQARSRGVMLPGERRPVQRISDEPPARLAKAHRYVVSKAERPFHKYVRREPDGSGGYRYIYERDGLTVPLHPIEHLAEVAAMPLDHHPDAVKHAIRGAVDCVRHGGGVEASDMRAIADRAEDNAALDAQLGPAGKQRAYARKHAARSIRAALAKLSPTIRRSARPGGLSKGMPLPAAVSASRAADRAHAKTVFTEPPQMPGDYGAMQDVVAAAASEDKDEERQARARRRGMTGKAKGGLGPMPSQGPTLVPAGATVRLPVAPKGGQTEPTRMGNSEEKFERPDLRALAGKMGGRTMRAMFTDKSGKHVEHPQSEAQVKWAFAAEKRGELPKGKAKEWARRFYGKMVEECLTGKADVDLRPIGPPKDAPSGPPAVDPTGGIHKYAPGTAPTGKMRGDGYSQVAGPLVGKQDKSPGSMPSQSSTLVPQGGTVRLPTQKLPDAGPTTQVVNLGPEGVSKPPAPGAPLPPIKRSWFTGDAESSELALVKSDEIVIVDSVDPVAMLQAARSRAPSALWDGRESPLPQPRAVSPREDPLGQNLQNPFPLRVDAD